MAVGDAGEKHENALSDSSSTAATSIHGVGAEIKTPKAEDRGDNKDVDSGAVSVNDVDMELGAQPHDGDGLDRVRTHASARSRLSRVLSRKRTPQQRLAPAPIPLSDLDAGVVGWESQDDPAMPLNFPQGKKWLIVGLLSAITLLTPLASSILAPGIGTLNREFDNHNDVVGAMTVSVYLLGYVIGPLFLAPLSELYGRRPVLTAANAFFCAWLIGCALAPSIESLIVFRFLSGVGGSGCLTLGAGIIADVFRVDQRGTAIGMYTLGPLIGPTVGPVAGSWLSQTIGWRWEFWIVFIFSVVVVLLYELFTTETNPRILMRRKVERLKKELNRADLRSCYDDPNAPKLSTARVLLNGLVRPTKMLFMSPTVFLISLYLAFTYGTLYLLFTTIPRVFQQTYGWSIGITGLVYICLGLGNLTGWAVVTATSDRNVIRRTKANGGVFEPEMRLPLTIAFSCVLPVTFFWYGWATEYETHWIVPVLGLFPFSFAIIGLFLPLTTYLVDCFPTYAASAVAANTVFRSLVGMLLPLAGPAMYADLGLGWGNSLLGFICVAMIPVPLLFFKFGGKLRKMGLQFV
ncbi:hypothetical protein VTH06DRAFT_7597 [Thermothelomyces fergusii]